MPRPEKEVHEGTATRIGNGAHVLVPKDWLGREVVCVPRDYLVAMVHNVHSETRGPAPGLHVRTGSAAYRRDPEGWQCLLHVDPESRRVRYWSAHGGWQEQPLRRLGDGLVAGGPLPATQRDWVLAVLAGEGLALGDLEPAHADPVQETMARIQAETDPELRLELVRQLERQLGQAD